MVRSYEELGITPLQPMTSNEVWQKYVKLPKEAQHEIKAWAVGGMDREKELELCAKWKGFYMVAPSGSHIIIEENSIQALG